MKKKIKTAFVLSGGGSLGAAQVGMLKALAELNVKPDVLIGASVGALNAAFIAMNRWPDCVKDLEELWISIKRQDVFPLDIPALVSAIIGKRNYLIDSSGLRKIIRDNLRAETFEECQIPLRVVVTEVLSGKVAIFSSGPLFEPLLASASIPGVFAPVEINGIFYMDGGVSDNTPISDALNLGAKEVYVLPTSYGCEPEEVPNSAMGMFLHTSNLLVNQGFRRDLENNQSKAKLEILKAPCGIIQSSYDFSQTQALIQQSYEMTMTTIGPKLANKKVINKRIKSSF